jgi:hypothetical protein
MQYSQFTNNCIARLFLRTFEFVIRYAIELILKFSLIFSSDNATCTSPDWHGNVLLLLHTISKNFNLPFRSIDDLRDHETISANPECDENNIYEFTS